MISFQDTDQLPVNPIQFSDQISFQNTDQLPIQSNSIFRSDQFSKVCGSSEIPNYIQFI